MTNDLRPNRFKELIGQDGTIEQLKIATKSANTTDSTVPHILLDGPPGLGKTTLAIAMATELNTNIQIANGANLRSIKSLIPFLMKAEERSILFIDEIHRITMIVEEFLYPAMEDFHITLGKNEDIIDMPLPRFTLIGATTDAGKLSTPFLDRFVYKCHLQRYNISEIVLLIKKNAEKLNLILSEDCCEAIAKCSRGTPRIANNILIWIKDYSIAKDTALNLNIVYDAIKCIGIDRDGLDTNDWKYIDVLTTYNSPVGIKTISCMSGISQDTIETVIEPYLLEKGLIKKTQKGRVLI